MVISDGFYAEPGDLQRFIGRTVINRDFVVGKLNTDPSVQGLEFHHNGALTVKQTEVEYLIYNNTYSYSWFEGHDGEPVDNAVLIQKRSGENRART
jgi:hypothetical protein